MSLFLVSLVEAVLKFLVQKFCINNSTVDIRSGMFAVKGNLSQAHGLRVNSRQPWFKKKFEGNWNPVLIGIFVSC